MIVYDLRSALKLLSDLDNELIYTNESVNSLMELTAIYSRIGAHGTVIRPTKIGPAMIFNNIKGYKDMRVLIGLLCSRKRVAYLLHSNPKELAFLLKDALKRPIKPVVIKNQKAVCQEVIYTAANNPNFDILKILPAQTSTTLDAGPYFTLGMCYAADPENGKYDITIHRLCVQSKNEISIYLVPNRHLDIFYKKAEMLDQSLPISISIGVDPAIAISSCFEPPTTPLGFDELSIAGCLRNKAVELVRCISINALAIGNAEIVIEGELLPHVRIREDLNTNTGKAMPEFTGYNGNAQKSIPLIKVKAITTRRHPILQTCIGPSDEHTNLVGIPTEASILQMTERAMPNFVINVHCPSPGTGKYLAIMQIKKIHKLDEGRQRQAALLAFSTFAELKHVILVDEDVDIFDMNDVMWAMTTRYQGDISTVFIPGVRCHPLDPSSDPEFSPSIRDHGITCKTIFDCTVPYSMKAQFIRSEFADIDIAPFL